MDQASILTKCQRFLSIDSVFHILEHHRVYLHNSGYSSWADFVNYNEIGIVADSSKL